MLMWRICELDKQWSFFGSKARQYWLWYAYNTKTGGVLAYTFGPRIDETYRELRALLAPCILVLCYHEQRIDLAKRMQPGAP